MQYSARDFFHPGDRQNEIILAYITPYNRKQIASPISTEDNKEHILQNERGIGVTDASQYDIDFYNQIPLKL